MKNAALKPGKINRQARLNRLGPQPARRPRGLLGNPEWEQAKAARRNIAHKEAVQESFFLQKQFRQLWSSRMAASPVDLNVVLRTLLAKKIPFVLTGAHAIGGWTGRPRDTHDIDILAKGGRNYTRAVNAPSRPCIHSWKYAASTESPPFLFPGKKNQ